MPMAEAPLRPAGAADAAPCAAIPQRWLDATPWIPDLHRIDETVGVVRHRLIGKRTMIVTEAEGAPRGSLARRADGCILSLTVAEGWRDRGIDTRLVAAAKAVRPGGLWLWCFVASEGARRFYARHGFRETARTEGDNAEGLPDIRLDWEAAR